MKKILLVLAILSTITCRVQHKEVENTTMLYEVYKIDSLNSYYLIYAKQQQNLYKIISKKTERNRCRKISINEFYKFDLVPYGLGIPVKGDNKWIPVNANEFNNCIELDDSTKVCRERYMDDLYHTSNIAGLCLVKRYHE